MKLHFSSLEDFAQQELATALSADHEISSGSAPIDDFSDGLVIGVDTSADDENIALANKKGIAVFSIPELICQLSQDKQRIVITGTHGKSAVASFVIHVMTYAGKSFDFFIKKKMPGINSAVKMTKAPVIIIEGSAGRSSTLNVKPQFLGFDHHMALITPLSHECKDQYPSFDDYVRQFDRLADATPKGGTLLYCEEDNLVTVIGGKERDDVKSFPYSSHPGEIDNSKAILKSHNGPVSVNVNTPHDIQNIGGALALIKRLSITEETFYKAIKTYTPN